MSGPNLTQLEIDIAERISKEYETVYKELEKNLADKYQGILQDNQRLGKFITELELKARHWDILKKAIDENPNIKMAWDNFCMLLRLSQSDTSFD
jgi:hypothetical protein